MKKNQQMSDSLLIGLILAMVGGFLDAYTYLCRGQVFANAQTGNIVLLGIQFIEGDYTKFFYYLMPIITFVFGVLICEMIKKYFYFHSIIHWRQMIIMIEMIVLIVVSFIPQGSFNMICNMIVSFVCSLQVQSFRKFEGYTYASTMCTGNLRSASEFLFQYIQTKNKDQLYICLKYSFIILFFIIGACLGTIMTNLWTTYALLFVSIILFIVFLLLFKKQDSFNVILT